MGGKVHALSQTAREQIWSSGLLKDAPSSARAASSVQRSAFSALTAAFSDLHSPVSAQTLDWRKRGEANGAPPSLIVAALEHKNNPKRCI